MSRGEVVVGKWRQLYLNNNKNLKNIWYIYVIEYYAAEKKKELLPFATAWVELESIMLSEIQIPYDLTSK